ncbi:MAG: GNAT family N-acetyltransferase [Hamadaea sp.]|uniref:GNAT family N-acetyltransferase n=1 Tax=Hamadaea sp. TaxID=2024425 RepID=UPI0017AD4CE2|nr:GNAT family N-acetyltransferase [Hamadaea sp.]NUR73148.1 GNAT family N-acetyltransferase [Hamadaea sp.]NUT18486.1 GNAT family N-acetyltransferase [Hamadaea sp.]
MFPEYADSALAENHFAFMGAQRGVLHRKGSAIELAGRVDFLSWWSPLIPDAEVPAGIATVRLFPWSPESWPPRLADLGFRPASELSYMDTRVRPGPAEPLPEDVTVEVVETEADAEAFAATQTAGFGEPADTEEDTAWWLAFLTEEIRRNYADPAQNFYLLRSGGTPAAVSLSVTTDGVCGVYGVATAPEFRRRGYATRLLDRIRADAASRGDERLALQVEPYSVAERIYLAAGFEPRFRSTLYSR